MSEIHGATGSYVLHALDPSELDEFEAHLADCETCRQEVLEFGETAAELSLVTAAPPPAALKGSIMSAISGVRVLPPETPEVETAVEVVRPRRAVGPVPTPESVTPSVAPLDELALRRQRRMTRVLSLAVAAAMVVALSRGAGGVSTVQPRNAPRAATTAETQVLNAADVKTYAVPLANGGQATFVASKSLNKAFVTSGNLPALSSDQTYQLWTLRSGAAARDNLLAGGGGAKQWFSGDIASADQLAISIEPAGGSDQPTTANILGAPEL